MRLLGAGVASAGGVGVGTGPSVGGQRPRNNNFMIDGVDNNRKDVTGPVLAIPNDAVAEFTVLQNQFSAEFGHSSGGQFNTVLRGGTNEIHGIVYEYLQNRDLNAIDQANKRQGIFTNPRYDQNRLGGADRRARSARTSCSTTASTSTIRWARPVSRRAARLTLPPPPVTRR